MQYVIGVVVAVLLIAVVVYLYYLLMRWIWVAVAPEFLTLVSVLGTVVVPVVYGMVVYRVFETPGKRRAFWAFIFGLLFLVYFDIAHIVLFTVQEFVPSQVSRMLADVLRPVVFELPFNRVGPLQLFAAGAHLGPAGFVDGLITKGVLVTLFLLLARGLENAYQDARQPAFRQYFFGQAMVDLRTVVGETVTLCVRMVTGAAIGIWRLSRGYHAIVFWPITATAFFALVLLTVAAAISLSVLLFIHLLGAAIIGAINLFIAAALFCVERAIILSRSGYVKCPHAGCHEPMPLPIFYCPACGAEHDRLIPGRCGVLSRACKCGMARLPTTFWLGKGRLRSACTHCKRPLLETLFGGSVHVPLYGAPSSGKTMFMMAATWQIVQNQLGGVKADFINDTDRMKYDADWRPGFESGRVREKTHALLPDAFLLSVRRSAGLPISLYMYDSAGEVATGGTEIAGHRFLRYFDAMALLIDPMSLASFQRIADESGAPSGTPTTAVVSPTEVVNHVINELESQAGLSRGDRYKRRVAVLITKSDLAIVQREFGFSLRAGPPGERWQDAGLDNDARIRAWLQRNEPGLWQLLHTRFADLRFFPVSALGKEPSSSERFEPKQVLEPLCWLLATRQVLARPRLARFAGRAAETAAACLVLLLFALLPGLGLARAVSWIGSTDVGGPGGSIGARNSSIDLACSEDSGCSIGACVLGHCRESKLPAGATCERDLDCVGVCTARRCVNSGGASASAAPSPKKPRECSLVLWDGAPRAWSKVNQCGGLGVQTGYYLRIARNEGPSASHAAVQKAWHEYIQTRLGTDSCPRATEMVFFDSDGETGAGILFPQKPPKWDAWVEAEPQWLLSDRGGVSVNYPICFAPTTERRMPTTWSNPSETQHGPVPPLIASDREPTAPPIESPPQPAPVVTASPLARCNDYGSCRVGCNAGAAKACLAVANMLFHGIGGAPRDRPAAYAAFVRACDGGDAAGCSNKGWRELAGEGTPKNGAAALTSFERSCTNQVTIGCFGVGVVLRGGFGVTADPVRAKEAFARGCAGGDAAACRAKAQMP